MKNTAIKFVIISAFLFQAINSLNAQNIITDYQANLSEVTQYQKTVFTITVDAEFDNPFDQNEIKLNMMFTEPDGSERKLPVFFESENGSESTWKAHFAPRQTGEYSYKFELFANNVLVYSTDENSFSAESSSDNGFIVKNSDPQDEWTFTYDSGKAFRGIGINIGWEHRVWDDPKYTYEYFFETLEEYGANFVRTWMHAWNLPLEWRQVTQTNIYSDSDEYFNPGAIERMDELIELSEEKGIYLMMALDAHGGFISDYEWPLNNYNSENGGPANSPQEFFTSDEAKKMYKNRLRYLVGRWGYSPAIAVWEFFNEVDNVRNAEQIADFHIFQWHNEMSTYLKSIDPYDHLVSTSVSHDEINQLYSVNDIDINQIHVYRQTHTIPDVVTNHNTGKPFVIGEFGREWDWNLDFSTIEDEKIYDYKRGLWYGLFHSTPILPMSWWWEWFDERDLFSYFKSVRIISDKMIEAGNGNFNKLENSFPSESFAVKSDSTVFAYIHNTGNSTLSSQTLSINSGEEYVYQARLFDPETLEFELLGNFNAANGNIVIPDLSLQSKQQKIIVLDPLESTSENDERPDVPFQLENNYPNPFNPSTNINFTIHRASGSNITIRVFDRLGREVQTVTNRQFFSQGEHQVPFEPDNLSSGLYIYRVSGSDHVQTGKMMLIK